MNCATAAIQVCGNSDCKQKNWPLRFEYTHEQPSYALAPLQMSTTATTVHRNRRPHPPPDTSKHYTEVPPRNVKEHSALYKIVKRLDPEIAFGELEPAEKIAVLVAALLVVMLAIGGPIYLVRYALS